MSDSITGKMNCLGCKKDKPRTEFASSNSPLCKRCKSARVVSTSSKGHSSSDGSWIGDIAEIILNGIGSLVD
jgi:hypothetical protein